MDHKKGGGTSREGFEKAGKLSLALAMSGGNPIVVLLGINDATKEQVSKNLNDNSGNSSVLSAYINSSHGFESDNVFGKDVVNILSLWVTAKGMKEKMNSQKSQWGEKPWEMAETIYDSWGTFCDLNDIFTGNYQNKSNIKNNNK